MKKPKKETKTNIKKECDKLWSKIVRERDQHCIVCGKTPVQAHHIFSRSYNSTRWDIDNGIGLCYYHHLYWAHQKYEEFREFILKHLGEDKFETLRLKSQQIRKINKEELEAEFQSLKDLSND